MTNRLVLALLLAPIAACKCGPDLNGISEAIICCSGPGCANAATSMPWDAGAIPVAAVEYSGQKGLEVVAVGQSNVEIEGIEIVDDGGGFSLYDGGADAGQLAVNGSAIPGQPVPVGVRFDPKQPGTDIGYAVIITDNGQLSCELIGVGIDECANINLDGGCDAGIDACAGTCTNGACQWPTSGSCEDGRYCITNGTCNGMGGCTGPSSCIPTGTCNGNSYTGQIATNDAGTGTCNGSSSPTVAGQCLFNNKTEACDCTCGMLPNGGTGCTYNWVPDPGSPADAFGSVWASQAGDAWASVATGAPQGNTIPQAFYERVNGTWTQQATLPLGSNPLSGAGGTVALTGDQSGNVFGASACSFEDLFFDIPGTSTPTGDCGDAGVWKWSNGAASVERLSPPAFTNSCGSLFDFPQTYPVMLGSTAALLNSDACGPELMTESSSGQFTIVGGSQLAVHCSAIAALWGTSTIDAYIAWGCGGSAGSGGIWHYKGAGLSTTPDFPFVSGNNDYAAAMAGTSDSDIWAVGTQRWYNNGSGWTQSAMAPPDGEPDNSLWSVGDQTYFAAGNYSGVYHYANSTWTHECLEPGYVGNDPSVSQVAGDSQGNFYAATQSGIFKRLDGGE